MSETGSKKDSDEQRNPNNVISLGHRRRRSRGHTFTFYATDEDLDRLSELQEWFGLDEQRERSATLRLAIDVAYSIIEKLHDGFRLEAHSPDGELFTYRIYGHEPFGETTLSPESGSPASGRSRTGLPDSLSSTGDPSQSVSEKRASRGRRPHKSRH